ncbi:hypothetical protein FOXB_07791 [Fusarium oxysporum f. sp. conglutinans Fo5176]|uniref:Uncharacterized protein n=1 Tax=Fusarium oxysporum (strain Fo5176) TaxID=660025 RepID=F9FN11_FUSOF|nr:hypothetical protein FOXB_07791 [Fusarium oxysporum f. sp. conglutinans Fo5176]
MPIIDKRLKNNSKVI